MLLLNTVQNNEELIKELQKQVEKSDGLVKDMEQKVISLQDHQISFLNDSVSNFWTVTSVAIAVVALVITLVTLYIGHVNRKAKQKLVQAEEKIATAEEIIRKAEIAMNEFSTEKAELENSRKELEDYRRETQTFRVETETRFAELTEFIKEISQIKEDTKILSILNQATGIAENIKLIVNAGYNEMELIKVMGELSEYRDLEREFNDFRAEFELLKRQITMPITDLRQAEQLIARYVISEEKANLIVRKLHLFASELQARHQEESRKKSTVQP